MLTYIALDRARIGTVPSMRSRRHGYTPCRLRICGATFAVAIRDAEAQDLVRRTLDRSSTQHALSLRRHDILVHVESISRHCVSSCLLCIDLVAIAPHAMPRAYSETRSTCSALADRLTLRVDRGPHSP
ncbi:50S ribosomal protein L25 [Candidatus Tremblaya princeps]|uniref:50S ribosomal protein L25 n=1 Tax=Tremblaya princeps TaxID=189385 RepID=A0A143WPT2_TREPR|nr:50S ribosomal protein L25 [Candidatus Tremblaya princeps]